MKISLLLTLVTTLNVSAVLYSQDAKLNFSIKNKAVIDVIHLIEQQSNYRFFFSDNYQDLNNLVTISAKENSIGEVLSTILKDKAITYRLLDNNIIVITPLETSIQQKISGTILDSTTGEPLTGVSIVVEGTTVGTVSDINGNYSIQVPGPNAVLVFNYVGFNTEKVQVKDQTTVNMSLILDIKNIQEVVVTALGIKRDKKALSYSSQQISEEEISKGRDMNFINSINGKAAGIELKSSNSGAGGSTQISLRGAKSLYGSNQPLLVIDGVPMANYQTSDAQGLWGGRDSGDGLSNLNPNDIESINILKGANASALYGSQGSNGVLLITTKKGKKDQSKIEVSSSITFQNASILPKLQTSYGQTTAGALESWGAKGSYANPVDNFYNTGVDMMNAVSLSGGNETTTAYFSYANTNSSGIMPTNTFNKNNVTFNQTSKFLNDKLTVSSNVMLIDQMVKNKVLNGYYFNPLTGLYLFPRGLDFDNYKKNYQTFNKNRNMYLQNWFVDNDTQQNPYWILNKNANTEDTKRVFGGVNLEYKINKDLIVQSRGNYDFTQQIYDQRIFAGTASALSTKNGRWIHSNVRSIQQYVDLLLNYNKKIGVFDLHGILGTAYQKKIIGDGTNVDSNQDGLVLPNEFDFNNLLKNSASNVLSGRDIKKSVFGNATIGFKDMLYLDVAARNDWSSALATTNHESYFFPSVGLSAIISEMVSLPATINFAKVRTSYSVVGKEVPAFLTVPLTSVSREGVTLNTTMPMDLKPEMQRSLELGAEMRFFNSRLGFEATYYNIDVRDMFLELTAPSGSGYSQYYLNAGQVINKGVELSVNIIPIQGKDYSWKSDINFSHTSNLIKKLDPSLGDNNYSVGGGDEGFQNYIKVGGSIGDIYVYKFARDSKGNMLLDDSNLPYKVTPESFVGSGNPKFKLGWNNTINYKNLSVGFLIDGRFGGKFVDLTEAWFDAYGVSQRSADARDAGGVQVNGVKADGTAVSTTVTAQAYYTRVGSRGSITEPYVYDATNIRLRQLVVSYTFGIKKYVKFFNNLTVSGVGQNLFFFYRPAPFDPESTISTSGVKTQGVESFSLPATRSYGFNVKLTF